MTKREYEKYHKVVYDKYGNQLYPGDLVIIPDGYYSDCHIAKVEHFAEKTVVVTVYHPKWKNYKQQRYSDRIIKVKSKDETTNFTESWFKELNIV